MKYNIEDIIKWCEKYGLPFIGENGFNNSTALNNDNMNSLCLYTGETTNNPSMNCSTNYAGTDSITLTVRGTRTVIL